VRLERDGVLVAESARPTLLGDGEPQERPVTLWSDG